MSLPPNFCPAPWTGLFYQNNKASICCADSVSLEMSPTEFLKSQHLADIRKEFLNGGKPKNCSSCWKNELQGLQSIRKHFVSRFPDLVPTDTDNLVKYMELRASNLCNMSCRMCWTRNSSQLEKEVMVTPKLAKWFGSPEVDHEINDKNWEEIKSLAENLKLLNLTGGEPMIIKKYHDILDHLIAKQRTQIELFIYTNASVYNPTFVDKLLKFKTWLNFSIDGVGETAEYQRYGIAWNVVENNLRRYLALPINQFVFHTTITAYNLLDFSSLINFYNQLLVDFPSVKNLSFKVHVAGDPAIRYTNLPAAMRSKALYEIQQSLPLMQRAGYSQMKAQLIKMSEVLKSSPVNPQAFVDATHDMDQSRDQNFESVFGLKLEV